jgi:hypothetical protein
MTSETRLLAIGIAVILTLIGSCPSTSLAQVWRQGISPQRAPNLIGELPAQPSRPSLSLPRFTPHNILPERMQVEPIPKTMFNHDNLLPKHLENQAIEMEAIVKEKLLPERSVRTILVPSRAANDVVKPSRLNFGSTIFLPALTLPPSETQRDRDKMQRGDMSLSNQRRTLDW